MVFTIRSGLPADYGSEYGSPITMSFSAPALGEGADLGEVLVLEWVSE